MRVAALGVLAALFLGVQGVRLGVADTTSATSQAQIPPRPGELETDFLLLQAYDLERDGNLPVKVGDRIGLKLAGLKRAGAQDAARDLKVRVPPGNSSLSDQGWAILPATKDSPEVFRFIAVPLKAGDLTLPSLAVVDASDKGIARSNPLPIKVESSFGASDKRELVPLRAPVSISFPVWIMVLVGLLVVAIVTAIVYGIFRWSKRKRKQAALVPSGPPKSEDEVALLALAELEKLGLAKRGDYKRHYFRVSEILKNYIGARYRFDAPESTSREIVVYLEERKAVADGAVDSLESLLTRLDLVKFTDHVPAGPEPLVVLQDAREWVKATRRPVPVQTPTEAKTP